MTTELRPPGWKVKPSLIKVDRIDPAAGPVPETLKVMLATGICLLLAFEPLAFGGVEAWAVFILEAGAALLLILWAAWGIAAQRLEVTPNALFAPMLLFAALLAVQLVFRRSAYWYATWQKTMLWAAYGILFFLITQAFRRTVWLRRMGVFFAVFGALVAVFAIAQQFAGNGKIYWVVPIQNGGWIYGPYVYHSSYAGLMEMLVPFPLVFAMASFYQKPVRVLFGFAALIMGSTIFLSQSLGGIVAFMAELVVLAILVLRGGQPRRQLLLLGLLVVLLAAWLVALQPAGLGSRLARLQDPLGHAGAADRMVIVKDSLKMIRQRPLLGWGFGNFPVVYPAFRSFYSNQVVNAAHNDFIELIAETGLLGCLLMVGFLATLYRTGMRRIEPWRRDPRSGIALAALIGCTGLLVHGLSDFNLQIPANAALFFALAALVTGTDGTRLIQ